MRQLLIISLLPIGLMACAAQAEDCKEINLTLDSEKIRTLTLDVGAGYLGIIGSDSSNAPIEIQAQACAGSSRRLEGMDILYERHGDTWEVQTDVSDRNYNIFSLFNGFYNTRIDIDIMVPAGLLLNIEDGSGNLDIRDFTGELVIDDGSGDLQISNVIGPVRIDDGSGDIELRDIEGRIVINDGSGDILIERVVGDVVIEDDGSGDIHVRDVQGDFIARDTGSGDVDFRDISGRIEVRD